MPEKIKCAICNKEFFCLYKHVGKHGIAASVYKKMYGPLAHDSWLTYRSSHQDVKAMSSRMKECCHTKEFVSRREEGRKRYLDNGGREALRKNGKKSMLGRKDPHIETLRRKGLEDWLENGGREQRSKLFKGLKKDSNFEGRRQMALSLSLQNNSSKLEDKIEDILKQENLTYTRQYRITNKYYDFFLPAYNMLLEIHGCYWHGCKYHYPDLPSGGNDSLKSQLAIQHGYKLVTIWEHDVNNHTKENLLDLILSGATTIHSAII